MPMNDVAAAVVYADPTTTTTTTMTNSSKAELLIHGSPASQPPSGNLLGTNLFGMQGQKWQQVFDLDKVVKQLRAAEKTYLRGGSGGNKPNGGESKQATAGTATVQVQRLYAPDMAYYDMVPKQATRDIVVCNSCNGSYSKAGFNNHVALQHPAIWDAIPNKLSPNITNEAYKNVGAVTATSISNETSQDGVAAPGELLGSPTDTLSGTLSTCSNGSTSSISLLHHSPYGGVANTNNNNNNNNASNNVTTSSSSSSSSSRHKSSKSSSSSSKASSSSSSGSSNRSRPKSSKSRHNPSPSTKKGNNNNNSSNTIASQLPTSAAVSTVTAAVKDDNASITVFSSSSNSSCSLPPTPKMDTELGVVYSENKKKVNSMKINNKEKPLVVDQQLSELDQAVCSITGSDDLNKKFSTAASTAAAGYDQHQHQVDLSAVTEEPVANTSEDNSISLTLDDMLDSKFINEILNTAEDIPFDESALDTSQSQPSQEQLDANNYQHLPPSNKRMRYDDGTINADAGDYAAAIYQQQQQQQQQHYDDHVYADGNNTDLEAHEQTQLTAIDAMQLQQLIYQQQQMLEQAEQKQQPLDVCGEASSTQFSVYNVPSLTDDGQAAAPQQTLDEQMILPSIIYEFTNSNQVSLHYQQSQQQVIAEILTQAGYDNVDVSNAMMQTGGVGAPSLHPPSSGVLPSTNHFNDELGNLDFTKLETVSADVNNTKTVKMETQQQPPPQQQQQQPQPSSSSSYNSYQPENVPQPHRQLANTKYHEDSYFNVLLYAGAPRPLAMNSFGLVKLPNSLGTTLRKNLLTTRKANNNLLSLNGHSPGVVGNLKPPQTSSHVNEFSIGNITITSNGNTGLSHQQQQQQPQNARKTIYAHRSSVIAQDRLSCNKRALVSKVPPDVKMGGMITAKRLNDLLLGKAKPEKEKATDNNEITDEQQQQQQQQQAANKGHSRMMSFYEKRRKLLAKNHHHSHGLLRRNVPLLASGSNVNSPHQQQQLLKKQLLRTLSDNSNIIATNKNPWKNSSNSSSSTPTSSSNSTAGDLMRVYV